MVNHVEIFLIFFFLFFIIHLNWIYNFIIILVKSSNSCEDPSNESLQKLNDDTTDLLINSKTLKICYQSKAIRDCIYDDTEQIEMKE